MTVSSSLKAIADPAKARLLSGYFKTGRGEYGEGDVFLGVTVPEMRKIAKGHLAMPFEDIAVLLRSGIHEERLVGLLILVARYQAAKRDETERKRIFEFYLANTHGVNNWDLVDLSAPEIVSDYLLEHVEERAVLYRLARSRNIWERRIAIMGTFRFIKARQFGDALKIAELLLEDEHDLIHKAVGWMLREIGKRDQGVEERFLKKHHRAMPRTMLRYAIEKFDPKKRGLYMKK